MRICFYCELLHISRADSVSCVIGHIKSVRDAVANTMPAIVLWTYLISCFCSIHADLYCETQKTVKTRSV